jgi:hypothetical protein
MTNEQKSEELERRFDKLEESVHQNYRLVLAIGVGIVVIYIYYLLLTIDDLQLGLRLGCNDPDRTGWEEKKSNPRVCNPGRRPGLNQRRKSNPAIKVNPQRKVGG